MPADALSAPLGQNKRSKQRFVLVVSMRQLVFGMLGLFVMGVGAWAIIGARPWAGQSTTAVPVNVSSAESGKKRERSDVAAKLEAVPAAHVQPESAPAEPVRAVPAPVKTITIIDGSSGKRQEIVIPETTERNAESSEPAETSPGTRNAGRPVPRPQR